MTARALLFFLVEAPAHVADGAQHAEESHGGLPHLLNWVALLARILHQPWMESWLNIIFSFMIMFLIFVSFAYVARNLRKLPGITQNLVEMIMGALDGFVQDVLGSEGRRFVPLIGTLFIYILTMNLAGLVPFFGHSPTSSLNVTLSLAVFVFLTVQITGLRQLGIIGYIKHFADLPGKPTVLQWCMVPLMFPLHIIGELAKPVSLSLRLFGNITGEDALIAIFVMLLAFVPLQLFMYPIVLIGSTIQALVFASLATVYLLMMSPHEEAH